MWLPCLIPLLPTPTPMAFMALNIIWLYIGSCPSQPQHLLASWSVHLLLKCFLKVCPPPSLTPGLVYTPPLLGNVLLIFTEPLRISTTWEASQFSEWHHHLPYCLGPKHRGCSWSRLTPPSPPAILQQLLSLLLPKTFPILRTSNHFPKDYCHPSQCLSWITKADPQLVSLCPHMTHTTHSLLSS